MKHLLLVLAEKVSYMTLFFLCIYTNTNIFICAGDLKVCHSTEHHFISLKQGFSTYFCCNINEPTPWDRVLSEKLIVSARTEQKVQYYVHKRLPNLKLCVPFHNMLFLYSEMLAPYEIQARGPSLGGSPRLLIQYIHSYPHILRLSPPSRIRECTMPWQQRTHLTHTV
jgi:hypothetical protein